MAVLRCFKESNNGSQIKGESGAREKLWKRLSFSQFIGWILVISSYSLLIPGLILPLYWFKSNGIRVDKTMFTTLDLVYELGGWFPACLVAFFGLVVPALKLIMLIVAHTFKHSWMSKLVVIVSKWAILDALVASIIMAYFAFAANGGLVSHVAAGFTCFVLYCVLSTAAALILDDEDVSFREIYEGEGRFSRKCPRSRLAAGFAVVVAAAFSITSLVLPTISVGIPGDVVTMSILSACQRLVTMMNSDWRPMILILFFVVIVPLTELLFLATMLIIPTNTFTSRCALRCLPQCGLLDVYNVGLVVMLIFVRAMGNLEVAIPPTGFVILCLANASTLIARFMVYRYLSHEFGRPSPNEVKPAVSHI
jgi:uncharacterized paraquat-inducible protein A